VKKEGWMADLLLDKLVWSIENYPWCPLSLV